MAGLRDSFNEALKDRDQSISDGNKFQQLLTPPSAKSVSAFSFNALLATIPIPGTKESPNAQLFFVCAFSSYYFFFSSNFSCRPLQSLTSSFAWSCLFC